MNDSKKQWAVSLLISYSMCFAGIVVYSLIHHVSLGKALIILGPPSLLSGLFLAWFFTWDAKRQVKRRQEAREMRQKEEARRQYEQRLHDKHEAKLERERIEQLQARERSRQYQARKAQTSTVSEPEIAARQESVEQSAN